MTKEDEDLTKRKRKAQREALKQPLKRESKTSQAIDTRIPIGAANVIQQDPFFTAVYHGPTPFVGNRIAIEHLLDSNWISLIDSFKRR